MYSVHPNLVTCSPQRAPQLFLIIQKGKVLLNSGQPEDNTTLEPVRKPEGIESQEVGMETGDTDMCFGNTFTKPGNSI